MKHIILLLLLLGCNFIPAQTKTSFHLTSTNNVGITSTKNDTLFLVDEPIGHHIQKTWYRKDSLGQDVYPIKPSFVFLTRDKFNAKLNSTILTEGRKQSKYKTTSAK